MSITDTSRSPAAQQQAATGVPFATQQDQADDTGRWSFHDYNGAGRGMPAANTNAMFSKLMEKLTEMYKQARDVKVTLVPLTTDQYPDLVYSVIVVAANKENGDTVAYTTLILESSVVKDLAPRKFNYLNKEYPVPLFPGDAMDKKLGDLIPQRVRQEIPNKTNYVACDQFVVPRTLNVEDETAVYMIAANAGIAVSTELDIRQSDFRSLNLAGMSKAATLVVSSQFSREIVTDAVSLPMRSDVTVTTSSRKSNNNQNQQQAFLLNTGDREIPVTGVSGYVDLAWSPLQMPGFGMQGGYPGMPMYPGMPLPSQKFVANFILTNIVSTDGYTLDRLLLAIASLANITQQDAWSLAFRPSLKALKNVGNNIDITDVGALNIDANVSMEESGYGTPLPTKDENFKVSDLKDFLARAIRPGLSISMDIPEAGAQSWYLSVFKSAVLVNNTPNEAYKAIYTAADQLTNGNFAKLFPFGKSFFQELNPGSGQYSDKIHAGWWEDLSGVKRDIRDFDHIAVCNLIGRTNADLIREWSDTFYRTDIPTEVRMNGRAERIDAFAQGKAHFTGRYDRLTLTSDFFQALVTAINQTQVNMVNQSPLSAGDLNTNRGIAQFAASAVVVPSLSLLNNGFANGVTNAGWFARPSHSVRWGQ